MELDEMDGLDGTRRPLPNGCPSSRRDSERGTRVWELPGTQQDPNFINRRIDNVRQPGSIFQIIRDQQQSLTGANLTMAFIKLAHLTTSETAKHDIRSHTVFKEMALTAAQNARLFSDDELAKILWALAQLNAEPPLEVMDTFACSFYSRMDKADIKVLSMSMWGLAKLDYVPAEKVLIRSCQSMAERLRLREGRLSDFASCFWALAVMGYCPTSAILQDYVALSCTCLGSLTPMEVSQMLWSFVQFGINPGRNFLSVVDALFCGAECLWNVEETSLLFWGMATYGYPLSQLFIFNAIDKVHIALPDTPWPVLVRTLSACARMCYHPGVTFLQDAALFLSAAVEDLYYEAIETILWSYATFSFHPGCELLSKLTAKIEGHLRLFSPLHLINILWCYALFNAQSTGIWRTVIEALRPHHVSDIPPEGLYRLFQVFLLKYGSADGSGVELPEAFQEAGHQLWMHQQTQQRNSPFHTEVLRILQSLCLQSKIFENFLLADRQLSVGFYIESLHRGLELIEEHEFTMNTTEPIGSAIMRTKIAQVLGSSVNVDFLKFTDWQMLPTDQEKQERLKRLLDVN